MALFRNPLTGQMEDDGVPAPPPPPSPAPAPVQAPALAPASVEAPQGTQALAVPPPVPQAQPPRVIETVDTSTTTGTSRQVASPEERKLLGEETRLVEEQVKLNEQARALGVQKAREEEAQALEKARLTAEKQAKTEEITQKGQEELASRLAEADRQYAELKKKSDIKDYWADKSTGDKVLAGLAVALGGIGAGMQGSQQNKALDIIQKNVEQDFERQKANFLQQKGVLDESRKGGEAGRQAIADQLNLLNLSKAAAYESLADRHAALAAKRGIPAAQLEADKVQLGLRQKALDSRQEFERSLRQTVTSNTVKTVNQELAKPVGMTDDVKKAQDEFQSNEDFKGWKEKRRALDSFKALREGGADGAAVADFIATGLKQGSFGPEMVNILEKKNLIDKAGNVIRENVIGGYNPKLLESLGNGLVASEGRARQRAKPVIERSRQVAKAQGLPPDYFTGQDIGPGKQARTVVRKQFNAGLNKTKLTYSDGTEEIVDGRQ